jgi:2-oxoisovalerate dehydrogenase E1 component
MSHLITPASDRVDAAPAAPALLTAQARTLYARALLIRRFEERLLALFADGKLFGTVHTCIGQELTGLAIAEYLADGDQVFSNHRCHGHYLARTDDVEGLLAEVMGKQTGICGGRGGSQHICSGGFFSNGIQGGIAPISTGLAFSHRLRADHNIVVVFIGDGTLGEGVLYESFNIASKWHVPLLVVLENNLYAQSTSQSETLAGSIGARAAAFGIETFHASTWDVDDLVRTAERSVSHVRTNGSPAFLQIDTYRLMAHSKGDDDRDRDEVKHYWSMDLLARFIAEDAEAPAIDAAVTARLDDAVRSAMAAPFTCASDTELPVAAAAVRWRPAPNGAAGERVVETLRNALERNMARDPRIVLLGEDIRSPYGGAFKVTRGLSDRFPDRVYNTPISEAGLVGVGIGLAMNGLRPVCELMFGDFIALAADQIINHASKFPYMYNGQVSIPLIVRTPMGGRRGYGATHSQSLEKHFLGLPQTLVLALNTRVDPGTVYDRLFESIDRLALVIENKTMYGQRLPGDAPAGFTVEHSDELFPTVRIRADAPADVTILCYGGLLPEVEQAISEAFDAEEIICEVICPTQLYPFDPAAVVDSVRATGRLLIIEEGASFSAFGAEVVSQLSEHSPGILRALKRLSAPGHPIPSCGPLEKELLPGTPHLRLAITEMCTRG